MKKKKLIAGADMINLGSQYAYFDFVYEGLPIKGVNLANSPQYLDYDLKYIKKYKASFKEGVKVVIVLPDFVFAVNASEMSRLNYAYYTEFYPWEIDYFSFSRWIKIIIRKIAGKIGHFIKASAQKITGKDKEYHRERLSIDEKYQAALLRINGWKKAIGIPSMETGDVPEHIKHNIKINICYLNEIIKEIRDSKGEPYIVIPPVSGIMNSMISKECMKAYLYDPINAREDKHVRVLDHLYDPDYQSIELFKNADCLDSVGARKFTREICMEVGLAVSKCEAE